MQINTTMRYHLTLVRVAIINKSTITSAEKGVEKRKPSYTVGGDVSWCSHYGKQYGGEPLYDPAIPLLGKYLEKTIIQKDTGIPMFKIGRAHA